MVTMNYLAAHGIQYKRTIELVTCAEVGSARGFGIFGQRRETPAGTGE